MVNTGNVWDFSEICGMWVICAFFLILEMFGNILGMFGNMWESFENLGIFEIFRHIGEYMGICGFML